MGIVALEVAGLSVRSADGEGEEKGSCSRKSPGQAYEKHHFHVTMEKITLLCR